jgi:hypothetical protein
MTEKIDSETLVRDIKAVCDERDTLVEQVDSMSGDLAYYKGVCDSLRDIAQENQKNILSSVRSDARLKGLIEASQDVLSARNMAVGWEEWNRRLDALQALVDKYKTLFVK